MTTAVPFVIRTAAAIGGGLRFTPVAPPQVASVAAQPSGTGRSIHTACMHGCPAYLALTDGRQVLLGGQALGPSQAGYVVSDAGKVSAGGRPLFEPPPDSLIVVPGMARP